MHLFGVIEEMSNVCSNLENSLTLSFPISCVHIAFCNPYSLINYSATDTIVQVYSVLDFEYMKIIV